VRFRQLLEDSRLLVFVGDGGVGKTSTAAAAGLWAASRGRHVAVLTVDPAPRLGDALGLGSLDGVPRPVALPTHASGGSLAAMRLDTKGTFDRMVETLAPSPHAAQALLANSIYQAVSGSLGGSDHYMTFQRLYELTKGPDYDLLVVDTPPAVHATELLSAPVRLADLIETGAPAILADPARIMARTGSSLAKATAAVILAVLERITGTGLRRQVTDFVSNFESTLTELSSRSEEIGVMLRASDTAFCLTTRPSPRGVAEALAFRDELADKDIDVGSILVNRITRGRGPERARSRRERTAGAPPGTLEAVTAMEAEIDSLRQAETRALERLRGILSDERTRTRRRSASLVSLPSLEHDVATTADLWVLADAMGRQ